MLRAPLLILAVVSLPLLADAQGVFASLEELWKYADTHNAAIRNADYEVSKAGYTKKQSYMAFLPQASVNGSFTDNMALQTTLIPAEITGGPAGVYKPIQFGQKYIYTTGFTAQMDIVNLQTWYNVRIAKETEEMNRADAGNTRKNTYQQIATLYYAYLLNAEAVKLATTSLAIADSVLQSVNNKYNEGTVSLASLDMAKLNKERVSQTLTAAQYQLLVVKNNLKGILGLSVNDTLNIETTLQKSMGPVTGASFTEDPAVRAAESRSRLSMSSYKAANATFAPTLSVFYSNTTQQNDNTFEPFRTGGPDWYPAKYWSLRATWNIFTGGSRWAQAHNNKISYYENKIMLEQAQRQSAINDENIKLSYQKASILLTKAENVMNLSYDNYAHVSNKYREGLASLDDRLAAFKDYIDYQNQYLNSLSDMLVQLYQVKIRQQTF